DIGRGAPTPATTRPLSPSAATALSGPLRLAAHPVHAAWRRAAVTACAFAGLHPDESAVASWRCSCDRFGVEHSALSRTLGRANCSRFGLASRGIAMKPAPFDYQAPAPF